MVVNDDDDESDEDDSCSDASGEVRGGRRKREQGTVDSNFETPSSSENEDGLFNQSVTGGRENTDRMTIGNNNPEGV